jgi:hypothetical protein
MNDYALTENVFLSPTPKGAYYATASSEIEPARSILQGLMSRDTTRNPVPDEIAAWTGETDNLALLYRMERVNWLAGTPEPSTLAVRNLEADMPAALAQISDEGRALLADTQGFPLAQAGFHHEIAEELSLLGAEIANLQHKYDNLIRSNLRLTSAAMGLLDSAGNSQFGAWPLYVGKQQFMLLIEGMPKFDQPAFLQVIWSLCWRYGAIAVDSV